MSKHKAHATPTKDFFVRMITRDISLEDCILDLIDNCLDGARKVRFSDSPDTIVTDYSGFHARVNFDGNHFEIADNCGGIRITEAIDYAFHFGRRANAPDDGDYSIGLYGIGMKRAIFKMGNLIDIHSSTTLEAFRTSINVNNWLTQTSPDGQAEDWDFDMDDAPLIPDTGTRIRITELDPSISAQFSNPGFGNGLARIVGRDYAQFISKGFAIYINDQKTMGFPFTVRQSEDFKPIRVSYTDETGVDVEIIAGMAGTPPDDLQPIEIRSETDYFGWFVLCNDRIVVASDKTDQTVWGDAGFPAWHYQYNGFIGVVSFHSKRPNLLPWRTTKRDVDSSSAVYRRAVEKMKEATRPWLKYTNDRKFDMENSKKREALASSKPLFNVQNNAKLEMPSVTPTSARIPASWIQYQRPLKEIAKAKKLLGNARMSNARVGEKTFEYFLESEAED